MESIPISFLVVLYSFLVQFQSIAVGHVYTLSFFQVVLGLFRVAVRIALALLQVGLTLLLRSVALSF